MDFERTDLASDLPENIQYQDEGCSLSNSCLECPFPCCVYDLHGGGPKFFKQSRNKEIIRLAKKGIKTKDLAVRFRLSQRSVQKIIQKRR